MVWLKIIIYFIPLTIQIANTQSPIANPNPNINTVSGGLSRLGIKYGTTVEPNDNWPIPKAKSDNLSSCDGSRTIFIYNTRVTEKIFRCQ